MKKRLMMTGIILAMAIAGTGCGAKSNSSEVAQAETTVKEEKKETAKSSKEDINTDEINNSNIDSEDIIQEEDSTETSDMSAGKQENNDSAKLSKAAETTSGKKVVTANSESNTTSSNSTTTNNTTTSKNNSESGKSNSSQQNTTTTTNNSQAIHTHTWQHIEATGHYETVITQDAWDEQVPVYENVEHTICNVCGADVTGNASAHSKAHALAYEGSGWHSEWKYEQTGTQVVHHAAVTEQKWIQDSQAYDKCTSCGETR